MSMHLVLNLDEQILKRKLGPCISRHFETQINELVTKHRFTEIKLIKAFSPKTFEPHIHN